MAFLWGDDRSSYGKIVKDMDNGCFKVTDSYPKMMSGVYRPITNYRHYTPQRKGWGGIFKCGGRKVHRQGQQE